MSFHFLYSNAVTSEDLLTLLGLPLLRVSQSLEVVNSFPEVMIFKYK